MARLRESLAQVSSRRAVCAKPDCSTGSRTLHRHHKRHQAIWLGIWAGRRRSEKRWEEFVSRYFLFHDDDCVTICRNHHAEIHDAYDYIITRDKAAVGKPLSKYSWTQAEKLMDKLEAACNEWLEIETPGKEWEGRPQYAS